MNRALHVFAALSLAALAAGCGSSENTPSTGTSTTGSTSRSDSGESDLTGLSFVSTELLGTEIPGGGPLMLEFPEPGQIAATAGCNRSFGPVELTGGVVATEQLASTMMACAPPADGADRWLADLLATQPTWALDGDVLTLTSGSVTVTLTDKKVVDPDRPVTGTEWVLTELRTADAVTTSAALEAAAPVLTIGEDGTVSGTTGCNQFSGSAQVGEGTITFEPLAVTLMACLEPELDEVQTLVLTVLDGETTYTVDGPNLRVTAADGVNGLGYRAVTN